MVATVEPRVHTRGARARRKFSHCQAKATAGASLGQALYARRARLKNIFELLDAGERQSQLEQKFLLGARAQEEDFRAPRLGQAWKRDLNETFLPGARARQKKT